MGVKGRRNIVGATRLLIHATGDVALQRKYPGTDFAKVAPVLRQADVVFGNLEFPIRSRGFCFEMPFPWLMDPQSILLRIEVDNRRIQRISYRPVLMDTERTPEILSLEHSAGRQIADLMEGLCAELGTRVACAGDEVVLLFDSASSC